MLKSGIPIAKQPIRLLEGLETILLISPQPWIGFKVSKHHYAAELARLGNRVFFLNPPESGRGTRGISLETVDLGDCRIESVRYRVWFPYSIKFHWKTLFAYGMSVQARRIVKRLGVGPSLVWDFDNDFQFQDLNWFESRRKIFHPVDQVPAGSVSTKNADVLLSVDASIAARFTGQDIPKLVVPHGLCREFEEYGQGILSSMRSCKSFHFSEGEPTRVGYVGNLLAHSIDRPAFLKIIRSHPGVQFELFGPYESDLKYPSPIVDWVNQIISQPNVRCHGLVTPQQILKAAPGIHLWLVCYDSMLDQNGGVNSHKVLEYLATGSPVVANRLDAYSDSGLLEMPQGKSNQDLPAIFERAVAALPELLSDESRTRRVEYALKHGYREHLKRIQMFINEKYETNAGLAR